MQPGGGLVFVTRQAQSKIDRVLRSSSRAMADILRPFLKLQERNKNKNKKKKTVADSLTCYPGWTESSWGSKASKATPIWPILFLFPNPLMSACQPFPTVPRPESSTLSIIQVCSVLVERNEWRPHKSVLLANPRFTPPVKSRGTVGAVRTVLGASWEDQTVGTVLKPGRERPRLPSEDGIGSLTSSPQSPLYL